MHLYLSGVELTVAQGLIKKMQQGGFLRQAARGKRYVCIVLRLVYNSVITINCES